MKTIRDPFIRRAFLAATLTACIAAPTAFAAGSWSPESSLGTVTISGSNVTYTSFPQVP